VEKPSPKPAARTPLLVLAVALIALGFGWGIGVFLSGGSLGAVRSAATPEAVSVGSTAVPPNSTAVPSNPTAATSATNQGTLVLNETFSNATSSVFGERDTEAARLQFVLNGFEIELRSPRFIAWDTTDEIYADVTITSTVAYPPDTAEVAAGVIFHYQDRDNFYLFSVGNDQYYMLEIKRDGEWEVLLGWNLSDVLDTQRNRIRVETQGRQIALYVNDVLLEQLDDAAFTQGNVGVAAVSFADTPAKVRFEALTIHTNS
jgi:hypothetical protein